MTPPPAPKTFSIVTPRRLARAALIAAALGLVGCSGSDDAEQAIVKARTDLETLGALYDRGVTGGEIDKVSYEKVISSLAKAADSSVPGQATAARMLRSRAYLRQGDQEAVAVGVQEREARQHAAAIRSYHNQWLDLNAQAQALQTFDASKGLAQIDADVKAKMAEIAQAKDALAKAEQELKSLQDRAAAAQEKSRAQRDRELDFRNQMIDKSQTQRADLVRQANEAKRTGDASDLEAADLLAQAGRQRPVIAELQTRVQRLEAQKLMQDASRDQLKAAAENARQQAARALAGGKDDIGAKQVGDSLAASVKELDDLRASIDDPAGKAASLYGQALGEVTKSQGGGGGGGRGAGGGADTKLAQAAVHHAHADLLLVRARGFENYAALMGLLAEAKPALPDAAEYKTKADKAKEAAEGALTEAKEKFAEARGLYENAGNAEKAQDVKDRIEQITKSLAVYDASKPEEAPSDQPADQPTDEVATVPATKPADAPVDQPTAATFEGEKAEVFALLQKFKEADDANNIDMFLPLIVFRNDEQEEAFKKMAPMMAKMGELSNACKEEFGESFDRLRKTTSGAMTVGPSSASGNPGERALQKISEDGLNPADININVLPGGDEAEVTFKSASDAVLECAKIEDQWRIKLDFEMGAMVKMVDDSMLQNLTQLYETMTTNVKSGKYGKDAKKMFDDFMKEAMKLAPKEGDDDGDK